MRSVGGLWTQITARENLTSAVWLAAKGRRGQPGIRRYLENLDQELGLLQDGLHDGQIRCGECHTFTIYDPKERRITAPVFRERVLHHAIMSVCGPVLDRRLIHHSYACRKGKGTYAALAAARAAAGKAPWFVKLDVRKYFDSLCHERLLALLERVFREKRLLEIFRLILAAYAPEPGRGLPIGTLISQHLANYYLSPLDVLVLQEQRPPGYVRHMDDMALWTMDREASKAARQSVICFAEQELGLTMKTAFINRSTHGMDFLGHRVFPDRLGLSRASRKRYQRRVRELAGGIERGAISERTAQERAVALTAFTLRADCVSWRRRVMKHLGGGPRAATACCAAVAGSTTAGTPPPASATATIRRSATTTTACVSPPAPAGSRSALMEPARLPAPAFDTPDETQRSRRRPVAPADAVRQRGRREHSPSNGAIPGPSDGAGMPRILPERFSHLS